PRSLRWRSRVRQAWCYVLPCGGSDRPVRGWGYCIPATRLEDVGSAVGAQVLAHALTVRLGGVALRGDVGQHADRLHLAPCGLCEAVTVVVRCEVGGIGAVDVAAVDEHAAERAGVALADAAPAGGFRVACHVHP